MSKKANAKEKRYAKQAEKKARREAEQAAKEGAKREAEEAKEKAKREAEEAKERAKREAEEAKRAREAEQAAKERAKREAEEAKEKAKREAEEAKERAKREAEEKVRAELYAGMVKLAIASPVDYDQVRKLGEYLRQVQNLRLVLVRGSVEEGTKIVVFAEKPIPLISVLKEMPLVEQVVKRGKEIQVTLRAKQ